MKYVYSILVAASIVLAACQSGGSGGVSSKDKQSTDREVRITELRQQQACHVGAKLSDDRSAIVEPKNNKDAANVILVSVPTAEATAKTYRVIQWCTRAKV